MKKGWHKYLVYASLLFLVVALYRADYIKIPEIYSYNALAWSLLFLFAGFIADVWSWKSILDQSDYKVSAKYCFAGAGLSIFTKFIPGKVFIIVGRAAYIAGKQNFPLSALTALSLNAQFISLWMGLSIGTIGLFFLEGIHLWKWLISALWLMLTIVIFTRVLHSLFEKMIRLIFRKELHLPQLHLKQLLRVAPWFASCWIFWALGYFFLAKGLCETDIPMVTGLIFPLSATLGVMAVIAPGGIGVREGLMAGTLALAGFDPVAATSIAVASRLWYLSGEGFIFISGWIADRYVK